MTVAIFQFVYMTLANNEMTDDVNAITTLRNATNLAIAARDLQPVLHIWREDVHITRGNGSFITGRLAMAAILQKEFSDTSFLPYYRGTENIVIHADKTMASEGGNWKAARVQHGNIVQTTGVYLAMWIKADDHWQIQAELYIALAHRATE